MKALSKLFPASLLATLLLLSGCSKEEVTPQSPAGAVTATSDGVTCPYTQISTPTIECYSSTQTSITVKVTAGATGTPGGFVIEYLKEADYIRNGNSFTGCITANYSSQENCLPPNGCINICIRDLVCGVKYVFRVRANAGYYASCSCQLPCSEYSCVIVCCTLPCTPTPPTPPTGCTYTQGYWKNHGPNPKSNGNQTNQWDVTSLVLGTVTYSDTRLQNILNTPVKGNGLISLAHQLIAAKLNRANLASAPQYVLDAISAADTLIGGRVIDGGGSLSTSATSSFTAILTSYNEGTSRGGPGHCN